MICGFQTARGSLYAIDPNTRKTTRFKKVTGEVDEPSMCLFVPPSASDYLNVFYFKNMLPFAIDERHPGIHKINIEDMKIHLRLGAVKTGDPETFFAFTDGISLPEGYRPVVAFINAETGKRLRIDGKIIQGSAFLEPQKGYTPVEERYLPNNRSLTHVGNIVGEVFTDPEKLLRAAIAANAPEKFINAISGEPPRTNNGLLPKPNGKAKRFTH
jgi:hypothetical protein